MDPNTMNGMEFFSGQDGQNAGSVQHQNADSSSAGAAQQASNDDSSWDPSIAMGMSEEITPNLMYSQQQQSQAGLPYRGFDGSSRHRGPAAAIQAATVNRKRDGHHERKRVKVASDAATALESVDYWIHHDDDDMDSNRIGGSFEIDFSRPRNDMSNLPRPIPAFNTMGSTPGLGTGLYTTTNPPLFTEDYFLDDAALDNALSEDEDGWESLNLTDHLSKIDTPAPTEVPPREGLYSTPLSWEKPQPGLRSDPLLSSFNPSMPLLSDMEQKNLLAIALNTNRPLPTNFVPNFGPGFGFGYGYDGLGDAFPTLGADSLLESLGAADLNDFSRPAEQPKPSPQSQHQHQHQPQPQPQSQPQPQPRLPSQMPMAPPCQPTNTRVRGQVPSQAQMHQPPQAAQNQMHQQPQQGREMQGPPSQGPQHPPASSETPAREDAPSTSQPRQPRPSESEGRAQDRTQPQETATAAGEAKPPSAQNAAEAAGVKEQEKPKSGDRAAHNDIERKYRTNLKDRISELRDCVPALRTVPEEGVAEEEGSAAAQRQPKVSKGAVMTKATEYIHLLERKNKAIMRDHQELTRRLQAFEQLLNATAMQPFPMPSYSRTLFDPRGFC